MSGRDETFVPSDAKETNPPPFPTAPPGFGQDAQVGDPLVVFKAADAHPGGRTFSGPPMAPDAEETMTPPPARFGTPVPDAEKTMTAPPPFDPAAAAAAPHTVPFGAMPPQAAPFAAPVDDAERTVVDPPMPGPDAERTMAVVRVGPGAETPESATAGPELTPDAILPPGFTPQAPPDTPHDIGGTATGPIPRLGPGASFPGGPGMPPPGGTSNGPSGARRALLAGGAVLGVLLIGGAAVLGVTELSGGSGKHKVAHSQAPVPPPVPTPTPSPTHAKKPKHKPKPPPVDIRDEKQDPRPLTVSEVFPSHHIKIGGHTFTIAKTVINDQCSLAANGSFAVELTRQHCRRVVRATFVSADKKIAVTTGIAVMPTDAAASASLKLQDPAHYQWFRGMKATGAPKIDQAGGYAASTMRGRYISYAYATYASGHKPAKNDKTLKSIGNGFRDSTIRAIIRRSHHH